VLLGNGDGSIQPATTYTVGTTPFSVAVGDFNRDGRLDLALADRSSNTVSVLLGIGDGSFRPAINYAVGSSPVSVAVGDFDGDGTPDLAVANNGSNTVSVLLGNGDGTFRPAVNYVAGSQPNAVVVGDFRGDGILDLAVANATAATSGTVSVLLGNGDGTFQPPMTYTVGTTPASVAVGDFNGDGHLDLAVVNANSNTVSVLLGNGNGTFRAATSYTVGTGPAFVAVGDFNGDGKIDLAVTNRRDLNGGWVDVLLGNGDGSFQNAVSYVTGFLGGRIAVADFNRDDYSDLAVTTANLAGGPDLPGVTVLRNAADTPSRLRFTVRSSVQAGTPFDVTVTAEDAYGHRAYGYTGTVHFSSADPYGATLPGDYTFTAADQGGHTFIAGATLYTAGIWDVTATSATGTIIGSATVQVTPAAATALVVTAPHTATAGMPFDLTVTAVDPYGNIDINYQGTVTFSTTDPDPGVMLPADYPFTGDDGGVHTFPGGATLYTVGTWDITAMDLANGLAGTGSVTVLNPPGPHRNPFAGGNYTGLLAQIGAAAAGAPPSPAPVAALGVGAIPGTEAPPVLRVAAELALTQLSQAETAFTPLPIVTPRHARDAVFEEWADALADLLAGDLVR
jgi:hypothetical protein